jgi:hypothetical protein
MISFWNGITTAAALVLLACAAGAAGATTHEALGGRGGVGRGAVVSLVAFGSGAALKQVRASENAEDGIRLDGPGGGNRVEKCAGTANQGPGVAIRSGSTGNTVQGNVALGNDAVDVVDDNPDCDADVWKKNVFETRGAPCIR